MPWKDVTVAIVDSYDGARYGRIHAPKGTTEDSIKEVLLRELPDGWSVGRFTQNFSDDPDLPEEFLLYVARPPIKKIEVTLTIGKEVGS